MGAAGGARLISWVVRVRDHKDHQQHQSVQGQRRDGCRGIAIAVRRARLINLTQQRQGGQ